MKRMCRYMLNYAEEIKTRLKIDEVIEKYGFSKNSGGFICCPFHNEKTPSLKIYSGNDSWHCFGCGANGDIITFVRKLYNLNFKSAISKLNDDFRLYLPLDRPLTLKERDEMIRADRARKVRREAIKSQREALQKEYEEALSEWIKFDDMKRKYKPKNEDCEIDKKFLIAINELPHAAFRLDCAEIAIYKFEHARGDKNER